MSMTEPAVSIVVPVYNGERYLVECVDSLRRQHLEDIEIILADDGSTDRTAELCDCCAAEDSRIKVLHLSHAGLSTTRNRGMEGAAGRFIAFVDADDRVDEKMYQHMLDTITKQKADMVMCAHVNYDGVRDHKVAYPWKHETVFEADDIRDRLLTAIVSPINLKGGLQPRVWGTIWKCLFDRQFISQHGLSFPPGFPFSQDVIFLLDVLLQLQKAVFINAPYYHYRNDPHQPSGVTQRYNPDVYLDQKRVQQYMQAVVSHVGLADRMTAQMDWRNMNTVVKGINNLCLKDSPLSWRERVTRAKHYLLESEYNRSFDQIGTAYHPAKEKIVLAAMRYGLVSLFITYKSWRNRLL